MPKGRKTAPKTPVKRMRPALDPEARENQLINLAVDLAEEQLLAKTASAQVITHFLKLATYKEKLEREKLIEENKLLRAKTEALESRERLEDLYAEAIEAMKEYGGRSAKDDPDIDGGDPDYEDY